MSYTEEDAYEDIVREEITPIEPERVLGAVEVHCNALEHYVFFRGKHRLGKCDCEVNNEGNPFLSNRETD